MHPNTVLGRKHITVILAGDFVNFVLDDTGKCPRKRWTRVTSALLPLAFYSQSTHKSLDGAQGQDDWS